MGALDPAKILMILVIALIVLGPERLPKAAQQLGAAWREVMKFREKLEAEVRSAIPDVDLPRLPARPGAAVATFLAGLTDTSKPLNGAASTTDATDVAAPVAAPADAVGGGSAPVDDDEAVNGDATLAGEPETTTGEAAVAESVSANAERQMQQIAVRRAAAMARAEGRGSAMPTIKATATAAPAPVQVGSGLEDSPIGFDDPSMN